MKIVLKLNLILVFFSIIFSIGYGEALINYERWQKDFYEANTFLSQKNYEAAIQEYKETLKIRPTSNVYFNMGIAYEQLNEIGAAVLSFEKSKALSFLSYYINDNIESLTLRYKLENYYHGNLYKILEMINYSIWVMSFFVIFWITLIVFCILKYKNQGSCKYVLLLLFFLVGGAVWVNSQYSIIHKKVVVVNSDGLKLAPTENSDTIVQLKSGDILRAIDVYKEYVKIQLSNKKQGWLQKNNVRFVYE